MGSGALSNPSSRKHRKNTSEERRKKKKIKTTKLKKRRHDSSSSSSGYFSSNSEDDDSRAPRKSSRRDPKRARRSLSRDEESSRHRRVRRKKSRGRDKGKREKTRSRRRDGSISSMSSYSSRSCSTCRGRSSSRDESGRERSRRLGRKGPIEKLSTMGRSRGVVKQRESRRTSREVVPKRNSSMYSHRSLSSSCSRCSHSRSISSGSHHSKDRFLKKNRMRRSQSAIKGTEESKETLRRYHISEDENREEIIQDYDDMPSSRSNGSYDGVRKRETGLAPLAFHPHALENKWCAEDSGVMRRADDARREEVSSADVFQRAENACDGDQYDLIQDLQSDEEPQTRLKSVISVHRSSPEADDLELLLRQKALENFRKFWHEPPANTKSLGNLRDDSTQMVPCSVGSQKTDEALMHHSAKPVVTPVTNITTKSPCSAGSQKMNEALTQPSAKPVVIPMKNITTKSPCIAGCLKTDEALVRPSAKPVVIPGKNTAKSPRSVGSQKMDEALMYPSAKPVVIPVKKNTTKSPCSAGSKKTDEAPMHPSAKPVVIPVKNTTKSLEHQRHAHDESYPTDLGDKSVANRPTQIPLIDPVQENHQNKLDGCPNNRTSSKVVVGSVVSDHVHSSHKYQDTPNLIQKLKESSDKKLLEKTSVVTTISDRKSATKLGSSGTYKVEVNKADGSSSGASRLNPEIGEHNSNEPKLEGKTGSEFEQKTMSVMRGGEMVQVSYKVYIPKKTPALARRQLQR